MTTAAQENSSLWFPSRVWSRLVWAFFFACAMGLLEAICVVYLRQSIIPAGSDLSNAPVLLGRTRIEHWREACTLIMLLATAWLAGFNGRSKLAYFFFMFGIWDILYYLGLVWWLHWPSSWLEWDCLFLIPKPWYGPVLAPVLISCYFIFACGLLIIREYSRFKLRMSLSVVMLQLFGFTLWYWSFVKDADRIVAQGFTGIYYSWWMFGIGMIGCIAGLALAMRIGKSLP